MVQRGITPLAADWELQSKRLLLLKRGHRTTLTGSLRKMKIQNLQELTGLECCCGTRGIKEHPGGTRGVRFVLGRLHCRMTKTYGSCSLKVAERAIEDKRNMREPDEQQEIVISLPPSRVGRLFVT